LNIIIIIIIIIIYLSQKIRYRVKLVSLNTLRIISDSLDK
jgi:hypothetical protein